MTTEPGMNKEPSVRPRKYLTGQDLKEAEEWKAIVTEVAQSSTCTRAKCGAIIVKYGKVIGQGSNGPYVGFESYCNPCMRSRLNIPHKTRYELCSGYHAERAALDDAIHNMLNTEKENRDKFDPCQARIYYIALDESGKPRGSEYPSCTLCSGPILKWGIEDVVLWHGGDNYEAYDTKTFHELSLRNMIIDSGL